MLQDAFSVALAAALERLIRDPALAESGKIGRLVLERINAAGEACHTVAYWLAVALPDGPGFTFAFSDDWEALSASLRVEPGGSSAAVGPPPVKGLSLLIRPGNVIEVWDSDWEELTGLTTQDLTGVPSDVVLDWLFPQQRDRDFVADVLHQPARRGAQTMLDVVSPSGSRRMLCTLLPVNSRYGELWLLLVSEPTALTGEVNQAPRFVRQFARGLSHLLNNYLTVPIGLAEMALDRDDISPQMAAWFEEILNSCQRAGGLIASLQDLAAGAAGDTVSVPLAQLVREFLDEHAPPERPYELAVELRDADVPVRVNRRMIKVVLRHLLTNAEQALLDQSQRRIAVRVFADEQTVSCEIEDNGEGLGTADWTVALAPFYSTKGPFARDAGHAALEAIGLGLTVSWHLLALHGGRLELRNNPDKGTTAVVVLPRADAVPTGKLPTQSEQETFSRDAVGERAG